MSTPSLEQRIRFQAAMRSQVKITRAVRSRRGFFVDVRTPDGFVSGSFAKTKREALQCLLAKVRTTEPLRFIIREAK